MAWTTPSGKTLGGTISVAEWNTYVRDNLAALAERPTCSVTDARTTATSREIVTATETIVRWFSEEWDSHGLHDVSANQSRITIPSGWGGIYLFACTLSISPGDPDGYRRARFLVNGSTEWGQAEEIPARGNARTAICCASLINLSPGDYVQVEVYQDSGSELTLLGADDDDELGCKLDVLYMAENAAGNGFAWELTGLGGKADLAEWWNDEVVGSFTKLRRRPAVHVTSSAASTTASSWHTHSFGTELFDNHAMWSAGAPTRMTITASGYYLLVGQVNFDGGLATTRMVRWQQNGTGTGWRANSFPTGYADFSMQCMFWGWLDSGDYMELQSWQSTGGALDASARMWGVWLGHRIAPTASQRLTGGWNDDAYAGGAQAGIMPHSWCQTHTRDLPGMVYAPPTIATRARFAPDITIGEWKKVKFNRQVADPWNLVKGKRNFGEKFVSPVDGVYITGAQITVKDDPVVSAKFTVKTTTFTVDTGTDVVTATSHGFRTSKRNEVFVSSTGTLPGGLVNTIPYYVRRLTDDTFTLHPTARDAQNNSNIVNITSTGSGTHRVSNSLIECRGLNLRTGVRVRFTTTGTLPLGLTGGTINWYVIRVGPDKFRVATTKEAAEDGDYTVIFDSGSGTHRVTVQEPYGSRGCRIVQAGEVQGGWLGSPGANFESARPAITIVAANAEDEMWVEAITTGPEGSRIPHKDPISRWFVMWQCPFDYTGALAIADRED